MVHFVELVGVASPEDVVGEVGSALGVRDSVSGRRVLTTEQRNDVRARIAQLLDQAPTLLILDNCEHVVEAVADLVAYLVATCRQLRVVTTTRAPLAIAAERVFALGQLSEDAAADLFCQRASAARPGVPLEDDAVRRVVRRLDGLPLAIELAAAKVRVMSVEDIDRRLDDRFALLRGGDRSAPDRHQTLIAVIDWSWNLLTEDERRALRWLSVFHDGFSLAGADDAARPRRARPGAVAGRPVAAHRDRRRRDGPLPDARDGPRVRPDAAGRLRRGRRGARRRTSPGPGGYASTHAAELWSPGQVAAVRAIAVEENNLADALRAAVAVPDPAATAELTAALAGFWTVRGENTRVIAIAAAVDDALAGWEPEPDEVDAAVTAAAVTALNTMVGEIAERTVVPGAPGEVRRPDDRPARQGTGRRARRPGRGRPDGHAGAAARRSTSRTATTGSPSRWRGSGRRTTSRTTATPSAPSRRPPAAWPWSTTPTAPGSGR